MIAIKGEHLKNLLATDPWREHFTTLSDILGFSLSVYTEFGKPIFVPQGKFPLCRGFRASTSGGKSECEATCHPFIAHAFETGKPEIYKCYARVVNFALPIEYMEEKAILLGQGSFATYEDFREYMALMSTAGLNTVPVSAPHSFTSIQQARKTCGFVSDTVNRLLKNSQEATTLRNKFESLQSIIGMWGADVEEIPETLYQDMLGKLSSLLDVDCISILTLDETSGKYTSLYGRSRSDEPVEALSISENDSIVKDLMAGKQAVLSAEPVVDPRADFLNGRGALYFFPLMVFRRLEGILRIEDRMLRDGDRQIISAFCKQTALLIENYHLHQKLYKKFNRFSAIAEMTRTITPIRNFDTLVRTILEKSAELLKAEQGSLMILDQETDELLLEAKKGVREGILDKIRIGRGEGIAGRVAEHGEPFLVANLEQDPRFKQKNKSNYKTRSFVSVPLKIDDRTIGVLNLSDKTSGEVFDEEDLKLIQSFATQAAVVMERNVFFTRSEELRRLTITDSLTGLLNRRYLNERLKDEVARSERYGHTLSLLMLDLDGFKYCNDSFGHLFGDKILKAVAETLMNTVRSMDIVARYGGDEFMIILPETAESLAVDIAERLRKNLTRTLTPPDEQQGAELRVLTASIGVACFPSQGSTIEALLENVDKALYRAKNNGKDRIEVYSYNAV